MPQGAKILSEFCPRRPYKQVLILPLARVQITVMRIRSASLSSWTFETASACIPQVRDDKFYVVAWPSITRIQGTGPNRPVQTDKYQECRQASERVSRQARSPRSSAEEHCEVGQTEHMHVARDRDGQGKRFLPGVRDDRVELPTTVVPPHGSRSASDRPLRSELNPQCLRDQ